MNFGKGVLLIGAAVTVMAISITVTMALNTPFLEAIQLSPIGSGERTFVTELVAPSGEAYNFVYAVQGKTTDTDYNMSGTANIIKNDVVIFDKSFSLTEHDRTNWLGVDNNDAYIICQDVNFDNVIKSGERFQLRIALAEQPQEKFTLWLVYTQTLKDKLFQRLRRKP